MKQIEMALGEKRRSSAAWRQKVASQSQSAVYHRRRKPKLEAWLISKTSEMRHRQYSCGEENGRENQYENSLKSRKCG
jgi:hypothetical protein